MFVVDITFQGNSSSTETVLVRRPYLTIGPDDSAHVIVGEMAELGYCLDITRQAGRAFTITPAAVEAGVTPVFRGGSFNGVASVDIGPVAFSVVALDLDLIVRENEPLDRAGVRIVRRAWSDAVADFPAVFVRSPTRAVISFPPDQPVTVGRSRQCGVRLDLASVSMQHARVGYESGQFWVEDLGSTNGTFVADKQVSSRITVAPGVPIRLGRNATIVGVTSPDQVSGAESGQQSTSPDVDRMYPALVCLSEVARPSRLVLRRGGDVTIGRDPSSDLWLGAPHVSRRHCRVHVAVSGIVGVTDTSTNGTGFDDGVLRNGESYETSDRPLVLDFGGGTTVAVCFNQEQEDRFKEAVGSVLAFSKAQVLAPASGAAVSQRAPRERRTTTWFNMQAEGLQGLQQQRGVRKNLSAMFLGLTPVGRVAIVLVGVGLVGLVGVVGSMLLSGLRW